MTDPAIFHAKFGASSATRACRQGQGCVFFIATGIADSLMRITGMLFGTAHCIDLFSLHSYGCLDQNARSGLIRYYSDERYIVKGFGTLQVN